MKINLEAFWQQLREKEDFRDGSALFNMVPTITPGEGSLNEKGSFNEWLFIIEIYDGNKRAIGVYVWDNIQKILHGPFALISETAQVSKVLAIKEGNSMMVGSTTTEEPIAETLTGYTWTDMGKVELYLYFGVKDRTGCVSGFEEGKVNIEEV